MEAGYRDEIWRLSLGYHLGQLEGHDTRPVMLQALGGYRSGPPIQRTHASRRCLVESGKLAGLNRSPSSTLAALDILTRGSR